MKIYITCTVESDDGGLSKVVYHRRIFLFKEQAFLEASKARNTSVMMFELKDSFSTEEVRKWVTSSQIDEEMEKFTKGFGYKKRGKD